MNLITDMFPRVNFKVENCAESDFLARSRSRSRFAYVAIEFRGIELNSWNSKRNSVNIWHISVTSTCYNDLRHVPVTYPLRKSSLNLALTSEELQN